jgi:hypothetical protein
MRIGELHVDGHVRVSAPCLHCVFVTWFVCEYLLVVAYSVHDTVLFPDQRLYCGTVLRYTRYSSTVFLCTTNLDWDHSKTGFKTTGSSST